MEENPITLGGKSKNDNVPQNAPEYVNQKPETRGGAANIDTEFIIATDHVPLPSKGKYYPNGQDSVQVKLLTAEEENILTSPDLIKNGKVLDVLLEHAIIDKTLRPDDMLTGDRNAVLLALRSTGYGDDYPVKMVCPECSESFVENVKLSTLAYKELQGEADSNGEFLIKLPRMKADVKFRLLNGKDETYLTKKLESMRKLKKNVGHQNMLTERYIIQIMEFNGSRDKIVISNAISAMPISDSAYLREYISAVEPGVDMTHTFECKHCGEVYEDNVPITAKLFWPSAKI
jgi:rubredoxin